MIKACIFDLDGTLLNTIPTIAYYCNRMLDEFGYEHIGMEEYRMFVGDGAKKLIERTLLRACVDVDKNFDKMYKYYTAEYDKDVSYLSKPYDGIPEMLAELKTMDISVGVLSNKPDFAAREAVKLFFGELVDAAYGGREDIALKPSPDGLFDIIEKFGVDAKECIYIGDSGVDMQTGKNAGICTIGVSWGFRSEEELRANGAHAIVHTPAELTEYIKSNF